MKRKYTKKFQIALKRFRSRFYELWGRDSIPTSAGTFKNDQYYRDMKNQLRKSYRNQETHNIAIWGSAGAGKSSFIRHFEAKTVHIPSSRFLYIALSHCYEGQSQYSKESVENNLARQLAQYPYRSPLFVTIDVFLLIISSCYVFKTTYWNNYLAIPTDMYLWLRGVFLIVGSVTFAILLNGVIKRFKVSNLRLIFKHGIKSPKVKMDLTLNSPELVDRLIDMRWRIRSTVVFEDIELLKEDVCLSLLRDLIQLNVELNNKARKTFLRRILCHKPIRFLYACRDGKIREKMGDKQFQDEIYIQDSLNYEELPFYVEEVINTEIAKGYYPGLVGEDEKIEFNFPYLTKISKLIDPDKLNKRTFNAVIKKYMDYLKNFYRKLGGNKPAKDDYTRLLGFSIYTHFFPEDKKKFKTGNCFALQIETKEELEKVMDSANCELFFYITHECPEEYRVNGLCIRYLSYRPDAENRYIEKFKAARNAREYEDAEYYITKAITCNPDKLDYYQMQMEVLKESGLKSEGALNNLVRLKR